MKHTIYRRHSSRRGWQPLRALLVPHSRNDYRPHLVRWYGIGLLLAIIVAMQAGYNALQTGEVLGQSRDTTTIELLQTTNRERERNGLEPLAYNFQLSQAATLKAEDMARYQYWSHTSPSGTEPWQWVELAGYDYTSAGENLGRGFSSADGVVRAWMDSPEHRSNLLNSAYHDVGFAVRDAVLDGRSTSVVVALYGSTRPMGTGAGGPAVLAATSNGPMSFMTRLGLGLQAMTPALLASIILLLLATVVALLAHFERHKLPHEWRKRLMHHHGAFKAFGMMSFAVLLLALYGGGQI